MNPTTVRADVAKPIVGVDIAIAKDCFQVAEADVHYHIQRNRRGPK